MVQEHRPPPVVTIMDPGRPGPLVDVLDSGDPAPFRPTRVQLIAATLAVVLLVAGGTVTAHFAEQARVDRAGLVSLQQVRFYSGYTGALHDPAVLEYLFVLVEPEPGALQVHAIRVTGVGWSAEAGVRSPVFPRRGEVVALRHRLDCSVAIRARPDAVVTIGAGRHRRDVPLELDPSFLTRAQDYQRLACGKLDAEAAIEVIAAPARRSGDHLLVDLALFNTSVYAVRVTGVTVQGLALTTSRRTPFVLPARTPGPALQPSALRLNELPRVPIRLVLQRPVCGPSGRLPSGMPRTPSLLVQVDGRGGAGTRRVVVEGLPRLVRDLCATAAAQLAVGT